MKIPKKRSNNKSRVAKKSVKPKRIKKHNQLSNSDQRKTKIINSRICNFFECANLDEIAKNTGYLIRQSVITPFIFIYALSMGLFGSEISLDLLAINMNGIFKTDLTGSAFSIRMGQKKSVLFLKACFEKFLTLQFQSAYDNSFSRVFSRFKSVILEDSTIVELNEKVRGFKGSGGAGSKSSVKLNFVFNICTYAAIAVDIFSGSIPDQKNSKKSLKYIKRGMLIIRDLGYFALSNLKVINEKGAYYLSRIPKGTYLYHNKNDKTPIDINLFFKKLTRGNRSAKIPIFMGKEDKFSTCLILQKIPNWAFKQRIKQYKKKNSGKSPSNEFVTWAKYSVFITNIPDELLINENETTSFKMLIMKIYRIRWQIELLFKKFKSKIKLNIIKGQDKNRVLCLIYGRLISILLSLMVLSYAASKNYKGREISLWKVISWLVNEGRLAKAILEGTLCKLYSNLCKQFKLLCKDKRNRPTALKELVNMLVLEKLAA